MGRTGDPLNPPDTPNVPPSDPDDPGCPPGYGWSGTTCAKNPDDNGNPPGGDTGGGNDGGDGDGGNTGGGSGGGGDSGGGNTGGGDGSSGGDGDGDGDGTGGPGSGAGGGGSGDGNGDGDGSGSGGGNGDGEEGEDDSSVGGEPCDATLTCEGDAVQCAILRQQKELRCHAEEQADFEKHESAIEAAVTGDRFQLDEGSGVIDVPSFINQGTRFLPSACPAAESFSLTTAGGSTFQLSYEPLCRAASDLSGLFVAVATVLAALYVGRGVGGQ
ncbi:virulence factor TspB C-terminal domain-related protein [Stutzerimonas stutzeri]|uniref:virulence factor TspB C-terminal domain-related protein n=1 Tax=Stutzerimonas stutzeri TaxID=316 RepID=UPI003C7AE2DB